MQVQSEFTIIGAGVAGLTTAIALQQLGRNYLLFEQSKVLTGIGAGFGLAANAMQALEILGLRKEVELIGQHLQHYNILDQKGRILVAPDTKALSKKYNQQNFAIHRADLHLYLLDKIQADHLQLNKKAVRFEKNNDGITLFFEDGSQHKTRYLIIADGVKSPLRQQLLPAAVPRYSGYTCWRATIDNSNISLKTGSETWGKQGRFGMTPLVRNRIYWYACINSTANNSKYRQYSVADLATHFADYHHPIPEILRQTQDKDLLWNDIIDIKPLKHFAYDAILLIGDAAHATTPNMGQGACQALEDVAVLKKVLSQHSTVETAFIAFEKQRLQRTKYITETSKLIGEVAQWENPIGIFLRNSIMKKLPAQLAQRNLNKLLSVDFMQL
ncbi:FAD-dependent monooxygenase [Sphingobacterium sp. Mn56C]|uniref:FAD-dependent monooxygenase n=1 Tax=Sphingobacterium sp. Mn56C TaxID=3395261 RepID=UPI003BC4DDD9